MIHIITFSSGSSPDTVYLEDLIGFQADLKDLDEFPEELNDIYSNCSNKSPEQEQEQFSCDSSPSSSACSQSSDQKSPPNSPFSHIKHSYTIPKASVSPERFNNFHHRSSLCTKHHSVLCTVCCVSGPHPEVLHQTPGVEAITSASQAQTHNPPTPALAPRTDDRSPTVESTPLLLTNRSPTAEHWSPTVPSPITVIKEAVTANKCSYHLLPKCITCGNCICCALRHTKQPKDCVQSSPAERPCVLQQLTIDIPTLNPSLKSPLSTTSLNTPVDQHSPVSPVPKALFISGTTPDKGLPSNTTDQAHIPCLLDLKVSPTQEFLKGHPPHDG